MKAPRAQPEFDKKLLADMADRELNEIEACKQRCRRLYRSARAIQKNDKRKENSKVMAQRLAALAPDELDAHERRLLSYFKVARVIRAEAEKEARRIWQRVVERSRREAP